MREVTLSLAKTCVRWDCTVRGETKSRAAMSLLPNPSLTSRTTSRSAGVSDSPAGCRAFAFTATALRISDRLLDRKGGALSPC